MNEAQLCEKQVSFLQVSGTYGDQEETVLYGVFNTPTNSIGGSAVCSFRLADISSAFEGQFKEQRNTGDNWLAVEPHRVPSPRPGGHRGHFIRE